MTYRCPNCGTNDMLRAEVTVPVAIEFRSEDGSPYCSLIDFDSVPDVPEDSDPMACGSCDFQATAREFKTRE